VPGLGTTGSLTPHMRIQQQHTSRDSHIAWVNNNHKHSSDAVSSTSYKAAHDVVPVTELMHKINLQATNTCKSCTHVKTLLHQTTSCAEAQEVRKWTRANLEIIHATGTWHIPSVAVIPIIFFWPRTNHNATTWVLAHSAHCKSTTTNPCQLKMTIFRLT
jgi:hypothetical protein